jgi:hypothetical protein
MRGENVKNAVSSEKVVSHVPLLRGLRGEGGQEQIQRL